MKNWQAHLQAGTPTSIMNKLHLSKTTESNNNQSQTFVCDLLKVAVDAHAGFLMVAWQMDGSNPKPPQKFLTKAFVQWIGKQAKLCKGVVCCYEAGPTGFWLHRQIVAVGVTNYVVCPTCLDSRRKGVNTDKTDALELLSRLDRYVAGNQKAFSIVRVPTEEEEKRRMVPRQREQLRSHRLSLASMGRTLMLLHGYRETNHWWKKGSWEELQTRLPAWLVERLSVFEKLIAGVQVELEALDKIIQAKAPEKRPKGLGGLAHEQIESEVCDWGRFRKWRQAGGYAGLTGGVSGSGEHLADLSITKSGNPRLRTTLIELAWRMVFYQPDYWLVKKWRKVLLNPKAHRRRRKQVIVAFARQLFVDLWKWKTGRASAQSLGWIMV
jgi:transposase